MADKQLYEDIIKRMKEGSDNLELDDLIGKGNSNLDTSMNARDTLEQTLAHQYMKDTGVSVPNLKTASRGDLERYVGDILSEQNPANKNVNVKVLDDMDSLGSFDPNTNTVKVGRNAKNIEDFTGTAFHEGAHAYDKKSGLFKSTAEDVWSPEKKALLKDFGIKNSLDLSKQDSAILNEIQQAGHHATIPKFREGSFGRGGLASLIKNKSFKALPFIGPALGAAAAINSGEASAAIPILNEADNLGPEEGSIESIVEDPTKSYEQRRKAIEQLSQRRIENGK
jgi:hypothetical protein